MAFKDLKNRKNLFDNIKSKVESRGMRDFSDDRYWNPEVDQAGNGFAIIRFLPAPEDEDMPYVEKYSHGFKVGSKWLIENCPTTIGQNCPICESNGELWETGSEMNKDIVRKRKRQLKYISNIMVISDSKHPENEGKVFLFRYGQKIFDKIKVAFNPEFEDEKPFNPFDFWEGADFKLKIRNESGFRNYNSSTFVVPAPLFDGDEELLEEVWKKEFSLLAEISSTQFKTYDEIKTRLDKVLKNNYSNDDGSEELLEEEKTRTMNTNTREKLKTTNNKNNDDSPPFETSDEGDDDNLDFYNKLLNS